MNNECMSSVDELKRSIVQAVGDVRESKPLVGSLTNAVTMDFVANAQLAIGASAAMVYLADEAECLVAAGSSFYVNMGTLLPLHAESIVAAGRASHEAGKPWVLDPVGIGIGTLRTSILAELKCFRPTIVRANASEVIALADLWGLESVPDALSRPRGVDSTDDVSVAAASAVAIARWTGGAVAVSGRDDLVTDGSSIVMLSGGSPLMEKVTGFGCSLGGVAASYAAIAAPFVAALAASAHYDVAGVRAEQGASAPASFKVAFIDELYRLSADEIAACPLSLERTIR